MVENTINYLIRRRVRDGEISVFKGPSETHYNEEANKLNREARPPIRYIWYSSSKV